VEYHSVTKKNEIKLFSGKWMQWIELKNVILSKRSQTDKYCMYSIICGSLQKDLKEEGLLRNVKETAWKGERKKGKRG
jgi:hypothetical protein